jgi:DNA primase
MSGRIDDDKIQEIRERLDIVEVIGGYLPLKRSGHNHQGLCPFHGEKTPSFNVNATRQIFHCFGCGVGGNVFSFVMRMEGLTFPETVRRLGERVGIEIAEEAPSPAELQRRQERELFGRINEAACDYYHRVLLDAPEGAVARRYLKGRGYDGEIARRFRLGYAGEGREQLKSHLAGLGFDPAQALRLGLLREERGGGSVDLFRRRLLFPIFDERGRVAAFGGRVLDDSLPKYLNSPESPLYHKGSTLYGLSLSREEMRRAGNALVVEGYFDLLALHRAGFTAAAAVCGTALTVEQVRLLKRYAGKVQLLFDQDSAGRKATFRAMEMLLPEEIPTTVVELPSGDDPDSFLREHGAEAFAERLAAARPVLDLFTEVTLERHGDSIEGRTRAVEEIVARLKLLPSEIGRSLYLKDLARRTGLDEALLQRRSAAARPAARPAEGPRSQPAPQQTPATAQRPAARAGVRPAVAAGAALQAQELLLQLMAGSSDYRQRVAAEGVATLFSDPLRRAVAEALLTVGDGSVEGIFNQLDEAQGAVLSGILVRDEKLTEDAERIFADCRGAGQREGLKQRSLELQRELREAEAAGDSEGQQRCLRELMQLKKRL